jgi:CARDB
MVRHWLAVALTSALMGCYVDPYPEDPFDPGFPEDPTIPQGNGRPDFQIESLSGPSALGMNSQGQLKARLCNRGDTSGSAEVSFFLSTDTVLDRNDQWVATSPRISLTDGFCQDARERAIIPAMPEGRYFLLAVTDPDGLVLEEWENNNLRVGSAIQVDFTAPAAPGLSWVPGANPPRLYAHAEPNASIRVYSNGNCAGTSLGGASAGQGSYCEVPVNTSSYSTSSYSARAYDAAGNASGCSTIPAPDGYGPGPGPGPGPTPDTTPPAAPVIVEANWQYGTTQHALRVRGTTEPGAARGCRPPRCSRARMGRSRRT